MISENYKRAIIDEVANSDEWKDYDIEDIEDAVDGMELTGNWVEDVAKVNMELDSIFDYPEDEEDIFDHPEEEKEPEQDIEEIVDSLHVGFNYVPGVGAGYCSNEEDLVKMKEFLRGALVAMQMMRTVSF